MARTAARKNPSTMKPYTKAMGHCMAGEISWLSAITETTFTPYRPRTPIQPRVIASTARFSTFRRVSGRRSFSTPTRSMLSIRMV